MQDMEIPTRDMHDPRGWARACLGTGRDVIPRSLESAVLHPRRTDRCGIELHMRGPDCLGLSRPTESAAVVHYLTAKDDAAASKQTSTRSLASQMMGP